jgi:hypothetical protein
MKNIFIFDKSIWSKIEMDKFLAENEIQSEIRIGFSHILSISPSNIKLKSFVKDKSIT